MLQLFAAIWQRCARSQRPKRMNTTTTTTTTDERCGQKARREKISMCKHKTTKKTSNNNNKQANWPRQQSGNWAAAAAAAAAMLGAPSSSSSANEATRFSRNETLEPSSYLAEKFVSRFLSCFFLLRESARSLYKVESIKQHNVSVFKQK